MSGEEREGQQRETFGLDAVHREICGTTIPASEAIEVVSHSPLAEHDEPTIICPSCRERIHAGELDLRTALLADEDDIRE